MENEAKVDPTLSLGDSVGFVKGRAYLCVEDGVVGFKKGVTYHAESPENLFNLSLPASPMSFVQTGGYDYVMKIKEMVESEHEYFKENVRKSSENPAHRWNPPLMRYIAVEKIHTCLYLGLIDEKTAGALKGWAESWA